MVVHWQPPEDAGKMSLVLQLWKDVKALDLGWIVVKTDQGK